MSHVTFHPIVHPVSLFSLLPSLNQESSPILFCRSQPQIMLGEVPARSWCGTPFWTRRLGAMSMLRVLNLLSVWCPRGLPMLSWCKPWLGGGRTTEMIHYTDLEVDFMHCPQGMAKECLWMARAFLLFLVGAYLFTTGGQHKQFTNWTKCSGN